MADALLHIVNGDIAGAVLQSSGLAGEVLVWREIYTAGPLQVSAHERAAWLYENYGIPEAEFLEGSEQQESRSREALANGRVALWMDPDLFDQAILMRICHIVSREHPAAELYLVELPNGPYSALQMREAWQARRLLSAENIAAAARAWEAYSALSRVSLEQWMIRDGAEYSLLSEVLKFQLNRFPGKDGLGVVERFVLKRLADDEVGHSFTELFRKASEHFPLFGMGDLQFSRILDNLSGCTPPLIRINSKQRVSGTRLPLYMDSSAGADGYMVYITVDGKSVAAGKSTAPAEAAEISSYHLSH